MGEVLRFPTASERRGWQSAHPTHPGNMVAIIDGRRPVGSRGWARDLAQARALHESPLGRRAFDLLVTGERELTRRIAVLESYCCAVWTAMPAFTCPELLHPVFWVDRLTVALVAADDVQRALGWCARVHGLPRRVIDEAAPSLRRALAQRERRCREAVARRP